MLKKAIVVLLCLLAGSVLSSAGVITFSSQAMFEAQGTIVYNTIFTCGSDFCYQSNPWTIGGVTYTTGDNLVVGPSAWYGTLVPVLVYNGWTPLTGDVETVPTHDMFGFQLGALGSTNPIDVTVYTNLGTYTYAGQVVPNVNTGMQFYGFVAGPGEYFTGFSLTAIYGSMTAPAITGVEVGNTGVPEPASFLMFGCGLAGLLALTKKLR
jgi:hypothetical protein